MKKGRLNVELTSKIASFEKFMLHCQQAAGSSEWVLYPPAYWKKRDDLGAPCDEENFWMWREELRRAYYVMVDLAEETDPKHFVHVSEDDNTKIAYTESPEKGRKDIQTRTTIGRYFKKYNPDMTDAEVKALAEEFKRKYGDAEVQFGESQEAFIRAVNEGPSESCMQGMSFNGHIHPAAVYASGDMMAAWVEEESRIVARTIINKGKKHFSRVYGDEDKLKPALEKLGYEQAKLALEGCRILRIDNENGNGYILPYIDAGTGSGGGAIRYKTYDPEHFILVSSEGWCTSAGNDNDGVSEAQDEFDEDSRTCDRCGDEDHYENMSYSEYHEVDICEYCARNHYEYAVVKHNRYGDFVKYLIRESECTWVECLNEFVLDDVINEIGIVEDVYSEEWIKEDEAVQCVVADDWCSEDDVTECGEIDGDTIYIHDSVIKESADKLYRDEERNLHWYKSDEILEWLDEEGARDEDKYVLLSKFEDYAAEVKTEPVVEGLKWVPVSASRKPLPVGTKIRRTGIASMRVDGDAVVVVDEGGTHIASTQFITTGSVHTRWCVSYQDQHTEALM